MSGERVVPRFPVVAGLALCAVGLAVSTYLTLEHFDTAVELACPATSRINCQKVTTSQYSTVLGIPVAVLGLCYFVVAVALLTPRAWRSPSRAVVGARLAWVSLGILTVVYLVWAELFGVNAICPWCTCVHAVTLLLFALVVLTEAWIVPPESPGG